MKKLQIAQFNIGRMLGPLDGPVMRGFVERLDEINALADSTPGFVWRLQTDAGNATYLRPYDDDRIIVNMSVWESLEDLRKFVFTGKHSEVLRQRREWFEKLETPITVLWWVPAGYIPSLDEAKKRLAHLEEHGPSPFAFSWRTPFPPDQEVMQATDWSAFEPCPAV
jgi:heme-degrading monooxygenase HmoA